MVKLTETAAEVDFLLTPFEIVSCKNRSYCYITEHFNSFFSQEFLPSLLSKLGARDKALGF